MSGKIAFLAEGKLYVKAGALAVRPIDSPFADGVLDRVQNNAERYGWRNRGDGMDPFSRMRWGGGPQGPTDVRVVRVTGLSCTPAGELLYSLDTGNVGGLFTYDLKEDYENRVFHKQDFQAKDLAHHPVEQLIAMSLPAEDGSAHLSLLQPGVRGMRRITEGDCVDEAPAWAPGTCKVIVYQTAGIGRNQRGMAVALGPYSVQKLDIDSQKLTQLLDDSKFDFLVPRLTADGSLYCIRRPYKSDGHQYVSPWKVALDLLLLPWRLIWAIYSFLHFFSLMFAGKPLTTAGGPRPEKVETKTMMLHGKMIDAEKLLKAAGKDKAVPLVPATWELLKISPDGAQAIVAKGVLSFDLAADGTVVYTNGSEIFEIPPGGKEQRVLAHKMVERVMAM
jgi:hypothetical protein